MSMPRENVSSTIRRAMADLRGASLGQAGGSAVTEGHFRVMNTNSPSVVAEACKLAEQRLRRKLKRMDQLQGRVFLDEIAIAGTSDEVVQKLAREIVSSVKAAYKEQIVSLSVLDRLTLRTEKQVLVQAYYEIGRDLSGELTGEADAAKFSNIHITNAHNVLSLWWNQAKHGELKSTVKSIPASVILGLLGTIQGTPIEGVTVDKAGQVTGVHASGHGLNLGGQAVSAAALATLATVFTGGAAIPMVAMLGLLTAGALGPLGMAAPLARQLGSANAALHELCHSLQFLTLGLAIKAGAINAKDMFTIQNDVNSIGYLWGGETEDATIEVEKSGRIEPLFRALLTLGARHLEKSGRTEDAKAYKESVEATRSRVLSRFGHRIPGEPAR